jgi:hypothetical protein
MTDRSWPATAAYHRTADDCVAPNTGCSGVIAKPGATESHSG